MKSKTLGNEELGNPKVTFGHPKSLSFLYKYRRRRRKRGFFLVRHRNNIVRRTILFAIKKYCLPIGERLVAISNVMLWMAER